ncbi:Gag-Pro-Pol polyprotein [Amphibalanus amphitrite]|uniref:Gag-Pro-Pol polyprotein n=1 Tax=Amphibalanus amphitrite TaxID=1232801 RepID=A0A6A4X200_AMPAM|nr:Gag-Pro-Pol polyprotein [Amphibalanus amphitrite]
MWKGMVSCWERSDASLVAVNDSPVLCCGRAVVSLGVRGATVSVRAVVVPARLLGVDVLLGMTGIDALQGVSVSGGSVRFGSDNPVASVDTAAVVQREAPPEREVCRAVDTAAVVQREAPPEREVCRAVDSAAVVQREVPPEREVRRAVDTATVVQREAPPEREVCRAVDTAAVVQREVPPEREVCRAVDTEPELRIDETDFTAVFDDVWTVRWKWAGGVAPPPLGNSIAQYGVPSCAREKFDAELALWISEGWLREYDETMYGPAQGLIPLMVVTQAAKDKVRPVLDYRELNQHLTRHTADADVCVEELRRWRRHGRRVAVLDLKKAFLQLRVDPALWPYQTVIVQGRRYCLTRVGFGLSIAPLIMKAVVRKVLAQSPGLAEAVLPYADDLLVNEAVVSADEVAEHFARFGLTCKPPERVATGARMLGLRVAESDGPALQWSRDGESPTQAPPVLTRRSVFAWAGQLTSHVPVAGWLRPAAAWMKRTANRLSPDWDTPIVSEELQREVDEVSRRFRACDPARGQWCVTGTSVVVWTDASSIARGVVLTDPDTGAIIEDASWLRAESERDVHINISELDAALNGVNLAVAWGFRRLTLRTDSVTVHRWLSDALSGKARLRTKAQSEMLIRRRVAVFRQLVIEYELEVTIELVASAVNRADEVTRVPNAWLQTADQPTTDSSKAQPVAVAAITSASASDIRTIHENIGHQGVRRTLWYARRELGVRRVSKPAVRDVVRRCQTCASIDPAPERWPGGSLGTERTWDRLAMDVTHVHGHPYLTLVDCGPSRYAIWRRLRRAGALEIVSELENVFLERGAPAEILTDNATEFRGRVMLAFAARWDVSIRFRAAYEPGGNGIVERHHRTIKVMVARQSCSVAEAVHRYNVTPKDGSDPATAPINGVLRHPGRDVDVTPRRTSDEPGDALPLKKPGVYQTRVKRSCLRRCGVVRVFEESRKDMAMVCQRM